jgi:hypothetical protein
MSKTILQLDFNYTMPVTEYEGLCQQAAPAIANVEGLLWKIFLLDAERQTAGGQYLFQSRAAAEAYLAGPIIAQLQQHPGIEDLTVRQYDIQEAPTHVTRGPLVSPGNGSSMAASHA